MRQRTFSSVFWMIIGAATAVHALQLGCGSLKQPGPGFIFFLSGSLLFLLSCIDVARGLRVSHNVASSSQAIWKGVRWDKVLIVLSCLAAYSFFLEIIGYILSSFTLILLLFKCVEPTKWWASVLSAVITTIMTYVIFGVWLGVNLPSGLLGF